MALDTYVGRQERREDAVWPVLVRGLAATLDLPPSAGDLLPPLWHWLLFQDWAAGQSLGKDGHPRPGGFLPAVPELPRRMWAGGRLQLLRGLRVGEPVARESTILKVVDKAGASGRLLFVTVGHETTDKAGIAIREEQDLVYQAASNTAVPPEPAAEPIAGSHRESAAIDSTLLFRYSALTGNGHRIHYDRDYAVNEEGYAGLVVHGPLQAILLANLARRLRADRELTEFAFRGRRPALLHQCPLGLEAWQEGSALLLRTVNTHGTVCTTATARFA